MEGGDGIAYSLCYLDRFSLVVDTNANCSTKRGLYSIEDGATGFHYVFMVCFFSLVGTRDTGFSILSIREATTDLKDYSFIDRCNVLLLGYEGVRYLRQWAIVLIQHTTRKRAIIIIV